MQNEQQKMNEIFNSVIEHSEIDFVMRGSFETYTLSIGNLIPCFDIGYNPKTGQYGLKRWEAIFVLYDAAEVNRDIKPNFTQLYDKVKTEYMLQVVRDNIEHLYF